MRRRYERNIGLSGLTLIESLIIIAVLAILALVAAPSFGNLLDSMRLNQAITEMRSTLASAQRQAIRQGESCDVAVLINQTGTGSEPSQLSSGIYANCVPQQGFTFDQKILTASNMVPLGTAVSADDTEESNQGTGNSKKNDQTARNAAWCANHPNLQWHRKCNEDQSSQNRTIAYAESTFGHNGNITFRVQSGTKNPVDPSGKLVVFSRRKKDGTKKCIAISRRLGLTRIGTYTGPLDPVDITDVGICTALEWNKQ